MRRGVAVRGRGTTLATEGDDDAATGCALCAAELAENAGVYDYGAADAGAGHRRECRHFYGGEFGAAAKPAGGESQDALASGRYERLLRELRELDKRRLQPFFDRHLRTDQEERAGV